MSDATAAAVILAAGKGTRMKSDLAKVLFPLEGRALIHHVVDAVEAAGFGRSLVVVGHQADRVRAELAGRNVEFALQAEQLGTGHAVQCAMPELEGFGGEVAVLAGDAPLVRPETLRHMLRTHRDAGGAVSILTAHLPDPTGYGRIVRDAGNRVTAIVEHKDATPDQLRIDEINSSMYVFDAGFLREALPALRNENRQGEYYLTDTVHFAFSRGLPVEGVVVEDFQEVAGINTPGQLEDAARVLRERAS